MEALIDAFALIAPAHPEAKLVIVHSGNRETRVIERRIAERGISAKVMLRDPLPTAELAAALPQFVCTVAPLADTPRNTHQGCCPVKIVESMASGVPVVATDLDVCRELICHEVDGLLAKHGDVRALAMALDRIMTDRAFRNWLANNAKRSAGERFDRANTHLKLRRVFREATRAAKGAAESWQAS